MSLNFPDKSYEVGKVFKIKKKMKVFQGLKVVRVIQMVIGEAEIVI